MIAPPIVKSKTAAFLLHLLLMNSSLVKASGKRLDIVRKGVTVGPSFNIETGKRKALVCKKSSNLLPSYTIFLS